MVDVPCFLTFHGYVSLRVVRNKIYVCSVNGQKFNLVGIRKKFTLNFRPDLDVIEDKQEVTRVIKSQFFSNFSVEMD